MRRLCGLLGLLWAGCMPIGYAYPTISYVRPARVGAPRDQVRAFRVDVTDDDSAMGVKENDRYVLSPLPLHHDGSFDPQYKVAVDYGWVWNVLALMYDNSTHHSVLVRLYRPGYQTVEVASRHRDQPIVWTPAATPEEQERAIDDLVSTWKTAPARLQNDYSIQGFVPPREPIVFRYLAPGSTSNAHRTTLRFAAAEYEHLLSEVDNADLHSRLEEKAKALRKLAAR